MKLVVEKDWCLAAAQREGDSEVGAGALAMDPVDVNSPEAALWSENMHLKSENEALRNVVTDMLAGLAYLRSTDRVPYGFGIDRLEQHGKAALGSVEQKRDET